MNERQVKFIFKKPEDHQVKYVNGAQGGVTLQGEIVINFFTEHPILPESQTLYFSENNDPKQTNITPPDLDGLAARDVHSSIIMSLHTAKSINNWLASIINKLESIQGN